MLSNAGTEHKLYPQYSNGSSSDSRIRSKQDIIILVSEVSKSSIASFAAIVAFCPPFVVISMYLLLPEYSIITAYAQQNVMHSKKRKFTDVSLRTGTLPAGISIRFSGSAAAYS